MFRVYGVTRDLRFVSEFKFMIPGYKYEKIKV